MLISGVVKGFEVVVAEINNHNEVNDITKLLTNGGITSKYPNLYLSSCDLDVPILIDSTSTDLSPLIDIFVNNRAQVNDNALVTIKSQLDSSFQLTIEGYKELFDAVGVLLEYLDNQVQLFIDFPLENYNNFSVTKRLVDSMNSKSGYKINIKDNKTLFRKSPNDELFVQIPSSESLVFLPPSGFLPNMKDVFIPYKNDKLNSLDYKNLLSSTSTAIEEVEGSSSNITGDLYDSEKRFYESLYELHKSCLKSEFPSCSIEDCIEHKTSSKIFKEYIFLLLKRVLRYNWNHKGFLPVAFEEDDDIDADDSSNSDANYSSASSSKMFYSARTDNSDGEAIIESILKLEFQKDIFYPINILIQCMRFGDKKPSRIELSGENSYFDLNTFMMANSTGSYANFEVKKTVSGCNYSPIAVILSNSRLFDTKFIESNRIIKPIINCPVGLVLKKEFVGTDQFQLILISFIDLLTWYGKDRYLSIEGFSTDNSGTLLCKDTLESSIKSLDITISLGDVLSRLRNSSDLFYTPYVSPFMKESYLKYSCFSNKLFMLSIFSDSIEKNDLSKYTTFCVYSEEELEMKCKEYLMAPSYILNSTMGVNICKLLCKVNDNYLRLQVSNPYSDLKDLIEVYYKVMDEQGFHGEVFSTGIDTNQPTSSNLETTSMFSKPVTEDTSEVIKVADEVEVPGTDFEIGIFDDRKFVDVIPVVLTELEVSKAEEALQSSKSNISIKNLGKLRTEVIVGYMGQANGKFFLLEPKDKGYNISKKYSLSKFKGNMLMLLRLVVTKSDSKVMFENMESFLYYCTIVEKL